MMSTLDVALSLPSPQGSKDKADWKQNATQLNSWEAATIHLTVALCVKSCVLGLEHGGH